jgi:hypothetical protein
VGTWGQTLRVASRYDPAVLSGFGAAKNNLHAPNENMPVKRSLQGIESAATIFQEFADRT